MTQTDGIRPAEDPAKETAAEPAKKPDDARKRKRKRARALRSFLIRLAALALVVYVLFFHIVGLTTMPNGDMTPRLDAGDVLLFYRLDRKPKARDIVVIDKKDRGRLVLRVVACPGDTVEITEEQGLSVNGNTQVEMKIYQPTRPYENGTAYPLTLKDGEYFVMADQRNGGVDSRYFGPVKQEEIQGIVITLLRRNNM